MDSLEKLQRRKDELKRQIEAQKADLKNTMLEIREEIEPATLLKKAVGGLFNPSNALKNDANTSGLERISTPLLTMASFLIKDPRWTFVVKWLAPLVLRMIPTKKTKTADETAMDADAVAPKKVKSRFYGQLRAGISSLRSRLRKNEKKEASITEQTQD